MWPAPGKPQKMEPEVHWENFTPCVLEGNIPNNQNGLDIRRPGEDPKRIRRRPGRDPEEDPEEDPGRRP
ncbi:hypothetical protein Tco_1121582 [Tanacetum coccineum]|uniref:Uncharacterized protein n=1 Tax=Tanacetum coccineum TaxID=301880 RepID=A0ABQ5IY62_9ASTR